MTLEQLISSPIAYTIFTVAWGFNWTVKRFTRGALWRSSPWFKLLLTVLPLLLGGAIGVIAFEGDNQVVLALAGVGAAAPAVLSYAALKQLSELPGLPESARSILAVLLERSEEGRARTEAAGAFNLEEESP